MRGDEETGHARLTLPAGTEDQGIGGVGDHVRSMVGEAGGGAEGVRGGGGNDSKRGEKESKESKTKKYL